MTDDSACDYVDNVGEDVDNDCVNYDDNDAVDA